MRFIRYRAVDRELCSLLHFLIGVGFDLLEFFLCGPFLLDYLFFESVDGISLLTLFDFFSCSVRLRIAGPVSAVPAGLDFYK